MHLSVKQVLERFERAEARKQQWRNMIEQCYEFALPQRNLHAGHWESGTAGQSKMDRVFDSTAINSTQRFSNRIQSTMFPPYRHWCRLKSGDDVPADSRETMDLALDMYNERMFAVLRQTNFDLAMSEFLLDLAVGTAVMMVVPGDETTPVRFEAVPQYLVSFEEGPHGTIDNVYRKMRLKGEAIQQQWPDAKLPERLQQMIDQKPHEDIDLLEATIYSIKDDYWCYHVIAADMREEIVYRELDSSMWIIARWMVCSGEIWGRGPLCTALPDILTLNATKRMLLQNASLAIAGMYTAADDGVLNPQNINIEPGAVIPVARNGGPQGPSLVPLARAGDFNLAQIVINDLSMSIKRTLLDDTLPPDTMSARSATEVGARMTELANNMGASFGRLITEAMVPLVKRILHVMEQENLIDMAGMRVDGRQVKIVPVSPLAKAQNMEELDSVLQFAQVAQSFGPSGAIALNQERALEFIADRLGVPARVLTTGDEKAEMMAAMQEMAEAAAEAQTAEAPTE